MESDLLRSLSMTPTPKKKIYDKEDVKDKHCNPLWFKPYEMSPIVVILIQWIPVGDGSKMFLMHHQQTEPESFSYEWRRKRQTYSSVLPSWQFFALVLLVPLWILLMKAEMERPTYWCCQANRKGCMKRKKYALFVHEFWRVILIWRFINFVDNLILLQFTCK